MYNQKLAAAIKVNGKVLREFKDTVYVPFGSEYSILVKNLNTVKSIVDIFIDGDNAVPGGLVLDPGREIDLERWIKNGNLSEGNRFKFIERTKSIEDHRGVKLEDGLIRIEHRFERVVQTFIGNGHWTYKPGEWVYADKKQYYTSQVEPFYSSVVRGMSASPDIVGMAQNSVQSSASLQNNLSATAVNAFVNDTGITVPGSKSDQKFQTARWFQTEDQLHSMVIKLLGETANNIPVMEPVTVKSKQKCTTCGKMNKANSKFCVECGTHLVSYS